ncbi:MAG: serine hydrolase [Streptosporangiaceae bacterium]
MKQSIVVTGASSGIGALTVRALARADHTVFAGIRDTQHAEGRTTREGRRTVLASLPSGGIAADAGRNPGRCEHRVNLADPIGKWLPGLIPDGRAITVRMLLNHTSGLFNYINDPDALKAFTGQDTRQWSPQELIAAAVRHRPLFAPGTEYSYSDTNYIALGLLLEKAAGHSLAALIQERIARPLGLENTYLDTSTPASARTRLAHGYEPDAAHIAALLPPGTPAGSAFAGPHVGDFVDTTWINTSTEWAAGGVVSTAADWSRFQAALMSGKLLPPGPAQGDGSHRLGRILHTEPLRAGPGTGRHAVRRRMGPRWPGPRLLQ